MSRSSFSIHTKCSTQTNNDSTSDQFTGGRGESIKSYIHLQSHPAVNNAINSNQEPSSEKHSPKINRHYNMTDVFVYRDVPHV